MKGKRLLMLYWVFTSLLVFAAVTGVFSNLAGLPLITTSSGATAAGYSGAELCSLCHRSEYEAWNQSYHNNLGLINITDGVKYYWLSPPWLHDGVTRIYTQAEDATEGFRCANCHTTGYDPITQTWPGWNSTDEEEAARLLGVQCEVCHGPGMTMEIDYAGDVCAACHGEGSHIQYLDARIGPHNETLSAASGDSCLSCHSTQGFLAAQGVMDEEVTLEAEDLTSVSCVVCHSPHDAAYEAQLRSESSTELCGVCHTGATHSPQYDTFIEGPHEKAGIECTDCHGQGTHLAHGSVSETFNHTFGIYSTYYPYTQTDPMVCTKCHDQTWATTQLGVIQEATDSVLEHVVEAILEADTAISAASEVSGVDQTKIDEAVALFEQAETLVESVEADMSSGLHDPEGTFKRLSEAQGLAGEASSIATNAALDVTAEQLSDAQDELSSIQGELSSTQMYLYVGGTGCIIGGLLLGLLVGRRWTSP